MQSDEKKSGQMLSTANIRLAILKLLLDNPLKRHSIHQRIKVYNYIDIETELRLLMQEGVLTARDRRFFIRNVPYARQFIHEDRRFGT